VGRRLILLVRRLRRHIGRRGAFLLFLAELDVIIALSLRLPLPYGLSPAQVYGLFAKVAPLDVWSDMFYGVALACTVAALWHPARPLAFPLAAALKTLWGLLYIVAWLSGAMGRGYLSAAIWLTFASVVLIVSSWPEEPARYR
jgi:hypothetical protein